MTSIPPIAHRQPRSLVSHLREGATRVLSFASRRLQAVRPDHVLWFVLITVFLLFVLVLILEPSAAGKGGR